MGGRPNLWFYVLNLLVGFLFMAASPACALGDELDAGGKLSGQDSPVTESDLGETATTSAVDGEVNTDFAAIETSPPYYDLGDLEETLGRHR